MMAHAVSHNVIMDKVCKDGKTKLLEESIDVISLHQS